MFVYDLKLKGVRKVFTFRTYDIAAKAMRTKGVDAYTIPKLHSNTSFLYKQGKLIGTMTEREVHQK